MIGQHGSDGAFGCAFSITLILNFNEKYLWK